MASSGDEIFMPPVALLLSDGMGRAVSLTGQALA